MQKTYHKQTAKLIATIVESVPEMSSAWMQRWIEDPVGVNKILAEAFKLPEFKIWKRLSMEVRFDNIREYFDALEERGCCVDLSIEPHVLPDIGLCRKEMEADLVLVTPKYLGFLNGATWGDIKKRALSIGLKLCPREVGLHLLWKCGFKHDENGKCTKDGFADIVFLNPFVAMEPMLDLDKDPFVFWIHAARLSSVKVLTERVFESDSNWVFVSKMKQCV